MYASGSVLTSVMLEALLPASFHERSLIEVYNTICGLHFEQKGKKPRYGTSHSSFFYVVLPSEYIGKTFGQLFDYFATNYGIIPMGLLRNDITPEYQNKLPFVLSNPPWNWLLRESDYVYVIGPKDCAE